MAGQHAASNTQAKTAKAAPQRNQEDCQHKTDVSLGSTPCGQSHGGSEGRSCGNSCHCTVSFVSPVILPAVVVNLDKEVESEGIPLVIIPIRLPAGFDFIWRPPKIA